jgi:peptidylprolyl isomerase
MAEARNGDTVTVHYTGSLKDGSVFDSSREREPLSFTIGEGKIIPGFEKAVLGMKPGESAKAEIPPEEGYGPHREEMVLAVDREQLPESLEPDIGQQLQMQRPDGNAMVVTVAEVSSTTVTLDANHPLAGKELVFDIELLDVRSS